MEVLKYDKTKSHQQYRSKNGTLLPGASTIAKVGGDSVEGLLYWAYNLGRTGRDFKKVREEAADIGTCTHFLIEAFLKSMEPDTSEFSGKVLEAATHGFTNFMDFWERGKFKPYKSEIQLASEVYGYGGTIDAVVLDAEDRLVMPDFKVTSGIYRGHFLQLSGYLKLWTEKFPDEPIDHAGITRIPKEQQKRVEEKWFFDGMPRYFDAFLASLNLYRALKKL